MRFSKFGETITIYKPNITEPYGDTELEISEELTGCFKRSLKDFWMKILETEKLSDLGKDISEFAGLYKLLKSVRHQ